MTREQVTIYGNGIKEKHTHYEAYPYVGNQIATVIISGDIASEFKKKYDYFIQECESFVVEIDFVRNDRHISSDQYKSANYLRGSIYSLDDIVGNPTGEKIHKSILK